MRPVVVLVDDDKVYLETAKDLIGNMGYSVLLASSPKEAKEIVHNSLIGPTIFLVDYDLPGGEKGDKLIEYFMHVSRFDVVCLLVTGHDDESTLASAFDCGGIGYFCKKGPEGHVHNLGELYLKHIGFAERMLDLLARRKRKDALTGALDREEGLTRFTDEWNRAKRHHTPISCIFVDVDKLKYINDTFGHLCGDKALAEIAKVMMEHVRSLDFVVRYGGDEFIIILPENDEDDALEIGGRILRYVHRIQLPVDKQKTMELSISYGVGVLHHDELGDDPVVSFKKLVGRADEEQYKCKEIHRTRFNQA